MRLMPILTRPLDITLRYCSLVVIATFVTYLSLLPSVRVESDFSPSLQAYDLPFHVFVYSILTFTTIWAIARQETQKRDRINLFLVCSLFGATLEILQAVLPSVNRSCTISDFLSNMAGAAFAAAFFPLSKLLSRK